MLAQRTPISLVGRIPSAELDLWKPSPTMVRAGVTPGATPGAMPVAPTITLLACTPTAGMLMAAVAVDMVPSGPRGGESAVGAAPAAPAAPPSSRSLWCDIRGVAPLPGDREGDTVKRPGPRASHVFVAAPPGQTDCTQCTQCTPTRPAYL